LKAAEIESRQLKLFAHEKRLIVDYKESAKWFRKAAEQGHVEAQCRLGAYHLKGLGDVEKDNNEAMKWFRKAAEQGHAEAQHELGVFYLKGLGDAILNEAMQLLFKAADQGYARAQFVLGTVYEHGILSVDVDSEEAVKWYTKAAIQDHSRAQLKLGSCYYYGSGIGMDLEVAKKWVEAAIDNGNDDAVRFWRKHKFHKL